MTKNIRKEHFLVGQNFYQSYYFILIFLQVLVATMGSLYFSEIAHFPPCVLCWYQRITMYPNILILGIGYFYKDKLAPLISFLLIQIGTLIALYHVLLYYKIIPNAIVPCSTGVSCTTKYIEWAGFITIPLLSLTAHLIVSGLLIVAWKKYRHH